MNEKEQAFSLKSLFVPFTTLKAIHIIIIVGFLVFSNALFNGFVWDDKVFILYNPDIHQIHFPQLFEQSNFNKATYYRPLVAAYFAVLYSLFGEHTFFYHFFQIMIHIGVTVLAFFVYKKFLPREIAFISALVFLVHPINVESVSYIASVGNILFVAFGLFAALLVINKKMTFKTGFVVCVALLMALLIKETAILFILALLILVVFFKPQGIKYLSIPLGVSILIYLLVRLLIGKVFFDKTGLMPIPVMDLSLDERLLQIPKIIFYYLKTFFFPKTLVIDQQWIVTKITISDFFLPLFIDTIFFGCLFLIGVHIYRKNRQQLKVYAFFLIWFLSGLLFHLQIIPLDMTVADRWFYFPLIGLLGVIGVALQEVSFPKNHIYIFFTVGIIVICSLALRTIIRNTNWQNAITLYSHDLQVGGDNYDIHNNLGDELMKNNQPNLAKIHFQKSIELAPNQSINWSNLGVVYALQGDTSTAQKYLLKAIQNNPSFYPAYEKYAYILLKNKTFSEAKIFLRAAIKKFPERSLLYIFLAEAEYKSGNKEEAIQSAYKAVQFDPSEYNRGIYNILKSNLPIE